MNTKGFLVRLTDEEREALRGQSVKESRSMQEVARLAIVERIRSAQRRERVEASVDRILTRDAELIDRLGK